MSRQAKPWFYNQTGWWMAWLDGKKVKLATRQLDWNAVCRGQHAAIAIQYPVGELINPPGG